MKPGALHATFFTSLVVHLVTPDDCLIICDILVLEIIPVTAHWVRLGRLVLLFFLNASIFTPYHSSCHIVLSWILGGRIDPPCIAVANVRRFFHTIFWSVTHFLIFVCFVYGRIIAHSIRIRVDMQCR